MQAINPQQKQLNDLVMHSRQIFMQAKAAESKILVDCKRTKKKVKIGIEHVVCQNGINVVKHHGGFFMRASLY